jgi:hypothetical protein
LVTQLRDLDADVALDAAQYPRHILHSLKNLLIKIPFDNLQKIVKMMLRRFEYQLAGA